ncbi:ketosteroid isomerase-like protein [Leucobacter exalbidus]|uniref:Ketosteroid isomerase-like protein n=1 Tax=Leucobacter exalbidus TaxID=662960 RepID=A0A940PSE6_9MICO|nr:hypothetical protein [Leucobacter exalbidus]MBP1325918.1 ketosteroid isomerase-like protein [Leucobacter exalbidus]
MTVSVAHKALADFNEGEAFFRHLSDTVVLGFPYGPSLGLLDRVVGVQAVRDRLGTAQSSGLRISDATIHDAGSHRCFAECIGSYRAEDGRTVDVPLAAVIEHNSERITLIREHWDTLRLATMNES